MPRKRLMDRIREAQFDPFALACQKALMEDDLPSEAPVDPTRPRMRDLWGRLVELQREYRATDERLGRVIAREFRDVVLEIGRTRDEPDTLYEFVASIIGAHPRGMPRPRGGGKRFARFCAEFMYHTKGRWAGDPMVLEPHQVKEANTIFAADPETGLRLIQEAYVQEPKKNGKSTRAAGVAGYLLCADDEPGPEVYGGATDKDQARMVFRQFVASVEQSRLRPFLRIYKDAVEVPSVGGFYKVIAADAISDEGVNMSGGILDELHHHENPQLHDMLSRSGDAREQPLLYCITNAPEYTDPDASACSRLRAQGLAVINQEPDCRDDLYASIDEVADHELEDRAAWMRVNPASWITLQVLERSRRKSRPVDFLRYRLNHPAADEEGGFLPAGAWDACQGAVTMPVGAQGWAGIDFATHKDTASVGWQVVRPDWHEGEPGRWVVGGHVWGVQPDDSNKPPPPCHTLLPKGKHISYAMVEDHVRWLGTQLDLEAIGYDPWRFARSAELLSDEGAPMTEFPQSNERTAPASEELLDAVVGRHIMHDGDPVLAAHIKNAITKSVGRGWRLDKTKARHAMDYATSLMMSHSLASHHSEPEPSIYETRGLAVIRGGRRAAVDEDEAEDGA